MQVRPSSKIALVDGDVVAYTAGFGAERVQYRLYTSEEDAARDLPALVSSRRKDIDAEAHKYRDAEIHRVLEQDPLEYALYKAKLILEKIVGHTGATDMKVFLTGKGNYREEIATYRKYKGNRDKSKKPRWIKGLQQYLIEHWDAVVIEGQEADDELAIQQLGTEDNTVICSTDKDLLQIPGEHYNIMREETTHVTPEDGLQTFLMQCITGDSTDNIAGCPGVGKKGAEKALASGMGWDMVVAAYKDRMYKKLPTDIRGVGDTLHYKHWKDARTVEKSIEEFALEMARLVYIRQKPGETWTP